MTQILRWLVIGSATAVFVSEETGLWCDNTYVTTDSVTGDVLSLDFVLE